MGKYKKTSGKLRIILDGEKRIIVKGDIIECEESKIKPFLDTFELLDTGIAEKEEKAEKTVLAGKFEVLFKGKDKYDVINIETQKPISDTYLSKQEVIELIGTFTEKADDKVLDTAKDVGKSNSTPTRRRSKSKKD